jgi:hypothetical protein
MARPLIQLGSIGPDVLEAKLRLNLAGAAPQLEPSDEFDVATQTAAEAFQASHGLQVDGQIGTDTWLLLDQLDGGRLLTALDLAGVNTTRESARLLLHGGDFATAKALLDIEYAKPGLPPELRSGVAAGLGWAEHGLGNFDRARDLLVEASIIAAMFPTGGVVPLRDLVHRLREINLGQAPGQLPSEQNKALLPPNG